MAITNNPMFQQLSGTIGKTVVYKEYHDKTVVTKVPDMSRRVLSEKQKECNERMRLATVYAKFIYKTEEGKAGARLRLKLPAHKSLFHALVKEHLDRYRQMPLEEVGRTFPDNMR